MIVLPYFACLENERCEAKFQLIEPPAALVPSPNIEPPAVNGLLALRVFGA
jgi:hypothetical protein